MEPFQARLRSNDGRWRFSVSSPSPHWARAPVRRRFPTYLHKNLDPKQPVHELSGLSTLGRGERFEVEGGSLPLKVSARYRHEHNISNVAVFDYDRNIVGGFLTLEFGSL